MGQQSPSPLLILPLTVLSTLEFVIRDGTSQHIRTVQIKSFWGFIAPSSLIKYYAERQDNNSIQ
ncbi:hypothetical protein D3C87_1161820 [compost metagenome]